MYSCLVGIFILASNSSNASFAQICQEKLTPFGCAMTSFKNLHPPFISSISVGAGQNRPGLTIFTQVDIENHEIQI